MKPVIIAILVLILLGFSLPLKTVHVIEFYWQETTLGEYIDVPYNCYTTIQWGDKGKRHRIYNEDCPIKAITYGKQSTP